jgi:hypothetical protein
MLKQWQNLQEYNSIVLICLVWKNYSDPDKMDKWIVKRRCKTKLMRLVLGKCEVKIAMDALRTPDDTPIKTFRGSVVV